MKEPSINLKHIREGVYEVEPVGNMRVPARIYVSDKLLQTALKDNAIDQAVNVACLPGIVKYSLAMPDIHWGYGFPIGGVAAFDVNEGIISPGGVGYDINCGVRLLVTSLKRKEVKPCLDELVRKLFSRIPCGVGSKSNINVSPKDFMKVLVEGARWAIARGYGSYSDLDFIEDRGCIDDADPSTVSAQAIERGKFQLGTLGSGNHFLEVAYVEEIFDENVARTFGIEKDVVTLMIHCGSRGFGHQICDDYIRVMIKASSKYGIYLPDRQLACAPFKSKEGQDYFRAMNCAINYAFANRQIIKGEIDKLLIELFGKECYVKTSYEVAHNIAKVEIHDIDGRKMKLCVHRKGATRAFYGDREEISEGYRKVGQPVLVPGDMARSSYVLVGTEMGMRETFGSTCHGAGRLMGRKEAKRHITAADVIKELKDRGIIVLSESRETLVEETPEAYKDVSDVVDACELSGISRKVARLKSMGCIKG